MSTKVKSKSRKKDASSVPKGKQASMSATGRLVNGVVSVAKGLPVIGSIVDKVESVASTILGFLGMGSSFYAVHYLHSGRRVLKEHTSVGDLAGVQPGTILMKVQIGPGPVGSRSRIMSQLFEKAQYRQVQLEVHPSCAATEPGSVAYVYVPDPSDETLEGMTSAQRLASVLSRENVQIAQLWQSCVLVFPCPQKEYFVSSLDSDIRLSSPGSIYVIAVTDLDPQKLPTIRQTSRITFSKATLNPSEIGLETCRWQVNHDGSDTLANVAMWDQTPDLTDQPLRLERKTSVNIYTSAGNVTVPAMRVSKGETITISCDLQLVGSFRWVTAANAVSIDPLHLVNMQEVPVVNGSLIGGSKLVMLVAQTDSVIFYWQNDWLGSDYLIFYNESAVAIDKAHSVVGGISDSALRTVSFVPEGRMVRRARVVPDPGLVRQAVATRVAIPCALTQPSAPSQECKETQRTGVVCATPQPFRAVPR